jgi:hypothetical protein
MLCRTLWATIVLTASACTNGTAGDLALESLHQKEAISFSVDSDRAVFTASSPPLQEFTGILYFDITIRSCPHPVAVIEIQLPHAATNLDAALKVWGHGMYEQVEKPLSQQDVTYIDSFLARYQAEGEIDPATRSDDINGWIRFCGPKKTQFYPGNPQLNWEFIRKIILTGK